MSIAHVHFGVNWMPLQSTAQKLNLFLYKQVCLSLSYIYMETLKNFESERILTILLRNLHMLHMEASIIASNLEILMPRMDIYLLAPIGKVLLMGCLSEENLSPK